MGKLFIILLSAFSLSSFVYAQQSGYKNIDVQLDGAKVTDAMADVGNIEVDFCNKPGEKTVSYDLSPGQTQKICYILSNYSDTGVDVHIGFLDATVTNDQRKNKACKQQGEITDFGQYVTGYQDIISLPARGEVQYFASLQFPETFTGNRNGCLAYYLGGVKMGGTMNFTVLMRRAKFIDVKIVESPKSKLESPWLWIGLVGLSLIGVTFLITRKTKK